MEEGTVFIRSFPARQDRTGEVKSLRGDREFGFFEKKTSSAIPAELADKMVRHG